MFVLNLQLFAYTGNSIVDYLKSVGQDSSFSARKKIAASLGISNYTGTASQNTQMLNSLRSGASASSKSTSNTTPTTTPTKTTSNVNINGVDKSVTDTMNSTFVQSNDVTNKYKEADDNYDYYKNLANTKDIIDQSTWDALNKDFVTSDAYNQAMQYTQSILDKLNSGRTSYTDQIKELMGQIQNREDFEYDVDKDTLFQQALASAMGSGKSAMQDTIGQASALTGGYGSTYATSAGNQAYNAFIEDAYNNLPEYYSMALQAYQAEGQEMYQQLDMLNAADATEWGRTYDAWQSNFANAQQMYNQEYGAWQDSINNAYNSANLQLAEHGQLVNDAYNLYITSKDSADTLYAQEYQKWSDLVAQATQIANMQNNDYWNQTNLDYQKSRDAVADSQWQKEYNLQLAANNATADKKGNVTVKQQTPTVKEPTEAQMKKALDAYNEGGDAALNKYVDSLSSDINIESIASYVDNYGTLPLEMRTYTKTKDTTNWFWGVDNNDVVKDQYGNKYKISDLPKSIQSALTKLKKGESYTKK